MTDKPTKEEVYRKALETICAFELPRRWYRITDKGWITEQEDIWLTRLREVHTVAYSALHPDAIEGEDELDEDVR